MRRTLFLRLCFFVALISVGAAIAIRIWQNPGQPSRDAFASLAPLFMVVVAQKAERWPKASVVLALLGTVFCVVTLVAVLDSAKLMSAA